MIHFLVNCDYQFHRKPVPPKTSIRNYIAWRVFGTSNWNTLIIVIVNTQQWLYPSHHGSQFSVWWFSVIHHTSYLNFSHPLVKPLFQSGNWTSWRKSSFGDTDSAGLHALLEGLLYDQRDDPVQHDQTAAAVGKHVVATCYTY